MTSTCTLFRLACLLFNLFDSTEAEVPEFESDDESGQEEFSPPLLLLPPPPPPPPALPPVEFFNGSDDGEEAFFKGESRGEDGEPPVFGDGEAAAAAA